MNLKSSHPECPSSLSPEQVSLYWKNGYLAFESVMDSHEVKEAKDSLQDILRDLMGHPGRFVYSPPDEAEGNHGGATIKSKDSDLFVQFEPGYDPSGKTLEEVEDKVRKFMWFEEAAPLFRTLHRSHPKVVGVLKGLLQSEFLLYQSMALVKPARIGAKKPWHQDNAYFSVEDLDKTIGVWIALEDATLENGCMIVLEGDHKRGPLKHEKTYDCEIVADRLKGSVGKAIELKAGGALFFHGNLPHMTPQNKSDKARRALQYHFRSKENAKIDPERYFEIFKEEDGSPATCYAARRGGF